MPYELEASGLELEIRMADLKYLKLHEEIVSSYLEDLVDSIGEEGMVYDPVIVDKVTGVVLDGMHRCVAVSNLGYNKIPACFIDYHNPKVELGSWCRFFKNLEMKKAVVICEDFGFDLVECDRDQVKKKLEKRVLQLFLISKEECFAILPEFDTVRNLFEAADEIEEALVDKDFKFRYIAEKNILEKLEQNETGILIPPAEKEEVIEVSHSASVFSHKMTRHVVPARPLRVDVPLSWLRENLYVADKNMSEQLEERKVKHLPAGSEFEGREYEEALVIFEEKNSTN